MYIKWHIVQTSHESLTIKHIKHKPYSWQEIRFTVGNSLWQTKYKIQKKQDHVCLTFFTQQCENFTPNGWKHINDSKTQKLPRLTVPKSFEKEYCSKCTHNTTLTNRFNAHQKVKNIAKTWCGCNTNEVVARYAKPIGQLHVSDWSFNLAHMNSLFTSPQKMNSSFATFWKLFPHGFLQNSTYQTWTAPTAAAKISQNYVHCGQVISVCGDC